MFRPGKVRGQDNATLPPRRNALPERHEKLSQGLRLILSLAGSRTGRSMADITEDLGCGRRTAERLLAAIRQVCGDLEEVPTSEPTKRWRMRPGPLTRSLALTVPEVVEIEAAARRLQEEGLHDRAATLRDAANKLRAMMDANALLRAETDVEALLASEGLAARPGPKVRVERGLIEALRNALLANQRIRVTYRGTSGERTHLLEPCGLLYGQRPYLLAVKTGKPDAAVWRLDRIVNVEASNEAFEARPGFDLKTLAAQCFGVWREAPMDVALRFTGTAAREAADWLFHASQTLEPQPDGSLVVRFRAGGMEEMVAHLAGWGETVEVLAPEALRHRLASLGQALVRRHGAAGA